MAEATTSQSEETGIAVRWILPGDMVPEPETQAALDGAWAALSGCADCIGAPDVPCDTVRIVDAHRTVMLAEAARAHGHLLTGHKADRLRPNFRAALKAGRALDEAQVSEARQFLTEAARAFWQAMAAPDTILTLPVPDGAPKIDGSTGFQNWLTPWTVFGGPLVSLPWGMDALARPRAVMLAGKPGADLQLLHLARKLDAFAPPIPAPVPPSP